MMLLAIIISFVVGVLAGIWFGAILFATAIDEALAGHPKREFIRRRLIAKGWRPPKVNDSVWCRGCGRSGSSLAEFTSPHTGLCGDCSRAAARAF